MTHALAEDKRQCDWDVQTYDYWLELLEKEGNDPKMPKSGIAVSRPWTKASRKDRLLTHLL